MMIDNKRGSSLSSLASSRKEKQSKCGEKDSHELIKGKLVRNSSSISSPSTPSKKGKKSESCVKDNDHHEFLKARVLTRRASSLSSSSTPSKKGKQIVKENDDDSLKGKLARRTNSFSSLPIRRDNHNDNLYPCKEKPLRKASLLSSSSTTNSSTKREKTSSVIKSRIKEQGPICKKRKEVLNSIELDDDIDVYLDKQIEGEEKKNSNDCLWLSSGSMSPQEFGLFMSAALDPCLDEWVLSFLPRSSSRTTRNACDGSKATIIPICEEASSCGGVEQGEVANEVVNKGSSTLDHSQTIVSCSSSSSIDSCSFWNMDRTGVWVSLINLDGEESELISDIDMKLDDLNSNFPSPSYEINFDSSYSSDDVVISSSQSEWSSDLLSDSLDWELESNDPIFWPFGVDCDWDHSNAFSISPRKGVYKIKFAPNEHHSNSSLSSSCVNNNTPGPGPDDDSIRFRLGSKNGKKIIFMSGLSASKMIEFKKGCRKSVAKGKNKFSKIAKRGSRYKRRVPPILENDLEGISPKETPPSNNNNNNPFSDIDLILSESCTDNLVDEMECESPIFWPNDQKKDWNLISWDNSFNISPRKGTQSNNYSSTNLGIGSPKNGFSVSTSVRLKFIPKSKKVSSLSASKSLKFKTTYHHQKKNKTTTTGSCSSKSSKRRCMFKSNHGEKSRKKFLKIGNNKSVHELVRLVSFVGMNKMFPGNEVNYYSEELPIETIVGLDAFAGHEGFAMEFDDPDFSVIA